MHWKPVCIIGSYLPVRCLGASSCLCNHKPTKLLENQKETLLLLFGARDYLFSPDEGSCSIFSTQIIVASFFHLMVLLPKVLFNHSWKLQFVVFHCHIKYVDSTVRRSGAKLNKAFSKKITFSFYISPYIFTIHVSRILHDWCYELILYSL